MRLAGLILAALLTASSADERSIRMLRDWIAAVDQHRAGETDAALFAISDLTYSDLELLRPYIELLIEAPAKGNNNRAVRLASVVRSDRTVVEEITADLKRRGRWDVFRRRAAILHTDAALLADPPKLIEPGAGTAKPPSRNAGPQPQRRINVRWFDGRYEGYEYSNPHWDLAMDALDALPASPRDPLVGEWYAAIGNHFVQHRNNADAIAHFDRARQLVPDDPRVLYIEARMHESLASARVQNFIRLTTLGTGMSIQGVESMRGELRKAEALLQRTLAADPAMAPARLHLGRVLMRQQRWREGLSFVERALSEMADPALLYYGHLFAGDAELALGSHDDAQRSFERALKLFPDSQSARLGLSAALGAAGDREEAVEAILPTLTAAPEGRAGDDPWWTYYDGNVDEALEGVDRMRAPFREPFR